jgi:hypothetical protein
MARIELLSTATSTGRSLHDHVGLKVSGRSFPEAIITATYASRSGHAARPI